jgi:multidrug resistance efflux pump
VALVSIALIAGSIFYFGFSGGDDRLSIEPILTKVEQGEFVSQVLDQGEVQSSENVEIRCQARARNGALSVISNVPEGTMVSPGDFLVRLDSTSFEKELETQKVAVANAETGVIQAEAALAAAKATLKEYVQGVFVEREKTIENEIFDAKTAIKTAEQEWTQAQAVLVHSKKLQNKGFITNQQLESDEFSVQRAKLQVEKGANSLALAEKKLEVLREITKEKEVNTLESDIKAAEVKLRNQEEAFKVEENQEQEIIDQIKYCEVVVPEGVSGQVVLGKESSRGGNDWVLEEGASVRENQVMIRLPNPDKMEIKALINEQSITRIRTGMPVSIRVDALNNVSLRGVVTKVNQYAESSGFMSSSVRKYAVIVKILDPPETLKPGMNASCSIQVQFQQDVLKAPIQTVYAVGNRQFCLVKKGPDEYVTREVEVADDNSQVVWIKSGVNEGEELVMNPGAYTEIMDLPEQNLEEKIELSEEEKSKAEQAAKDGASDEQVAGGGEGRGGNRGGQGGGRQGGGGGRPGGAGAGGGGMPSMDQMVDRTMGRYDTNGDAKIDKEEMASLDDRVKGFVGRADGNGDGEITKEEMKKSFESMMNRGGGGGGFGGGGN